MGIEQILLPILGGIAKGTGEGLEIKRREQAAAAATRDAKLSAKVLDDFELAQSPDMQRFMQRYHGKEQWKALQSVMRIKHFEQQWQNREIEHGRLNPNPMPADFMPPMPPEPADGEGNQWSILGLISQFVPGAKQAMQALNIGGGEAQAQMSPPSSTGPASGPQGYPQTTPQAPPVGGWQPAGVAGREALVNQIPRVDAPAAAPAGGGPVSGWQPVVPARVPVSPATLAAMDERMGPAAVGQVPTTTMTRTPRGGMTLTVEGGAAPTQTATQAAFTSTKYPSATTLPDGVSVTIGKDNKRTYNIRNPNKNIPDKLYEAQKLYEMATGAPADMNNAAHALQVIKLSHALDTEELINKIGTEVRTRAEVESDPVVKEQLALVKYVTTQATQRAERDVAGEPESIDVRRREAEATAGGGVMGKAAAENSPIVGPNGQPMVFDAQGNSLTPKQLEILQAGQQARVVDQSKPLEGAERKVYQQQEFLLKLGQDALDLYAKVGDKAIRPFLATNNAIEWRKFFGTLDPHEQDLHSTIHDIHNTSINILTGAGYSDLQAEKLIGPLPKMAVGNPALFKQELDRFMRNAKYQTDEALRLIQTPRGELRGAGEPKTPSRTATTPTTPAKIAVPVAGADAPVAKTGKFKGQKMNNVIPGVPVPAPHDATKTRPAYQVPASAFGPSGKLTKAALAEMQRAQQAGELPEDFDIQPIPDEEFNRLQGAP